jgi:hypothetical protein
MVMGTVRYAVYTTGALLCVNYDQVLADHVTLSLTHASLKKYFVERSVDFLRASPWNVSVALTLRNVQPQLNSYVLLCLLIFLHFCRDLN